MSIDWSERISSRVTQLLSEQHGDRIFPLLCLDECCNNQRVYDMVKALMLKGLAAGSTDLWYQWRQRENGERCMVRGSLPTGSEIPGFDVGRLIDGQGWEDARVVDLLITEFLGHSHLVLLTADKRKKGLSLRSLLHQHVKPALESNHGDRYSLTVIYKNPKIGNMFPATMSILCSEGFRHFKCSNHAARIPAAARLGQAAEVILWDKFGFMG